MPPKKINADRRLPAKKKQKEKNKWPLRTFLGVEKTTSQGLNKRCLPFRGRWRSQKRIKKMPFRFWERSLPEPPRGAKKKKNKCPGNNTREEQKNTADTTGRAKKKKTQRSKTHPRRTNKYDKCPEEHPNHCKKY